MKKQRQKRKGLLLATDDLEIGQYITVHSLKNSQQLLPFFGKAMLITAINLPFLVVRAVIDGEVATLDVRFVNLMRVSEEFVQAQEKDKKRV